MTNKLALAVSATSLALLIATPVTATDYSEAPVLQELVQSGQLPPLEERLPIQPMVVEVTEIGDYGGTWRSALKGNNDQGWIRRSVGYEPLVKFTYDWSGIEANVAHDWDVNEDATVYTFYLREGHRWSDGTPFTANDVAFYINDVVNHPDYTGIKPAYYRDAVVSVPDPYTAVFTLPEANGLFLQQVASVDGVIATHFQQEFCQQFHPDYNPQANDNAIAQGLTGWGDAMRFTCGAQRGRSADRPTIHAWMPLDDYDGINTPVRFERNPYYFKVDQDGNQLPYINDLQMTQVEDVNSIVLMGVAGEIDFMNRHIDLIENKPVFFDAQESGDFQLYDTVLADMNTAIIQLNLNHEDDGFRTLFQDRDFRIALSHGIDRQEIIDVLYAGQGQPWQASPRPSSPFHNAELAQQFTEFDPDLANSMLDELGLSERNSDGVRLMPDGRPLSIQVYISTDLGPQLSIMELVKIHWEEIGVALDLRRSERSFVYDLKDNSEHMMHVWKGDGGLGDAMLDPRYYMPTNMESAWAIRWAENWYAPDAPTVQTPPASVQRQHELYAEMSGNPEPAEREQLFAQILDIAQEEFFVIGISLPPSSYGIARNSVGNVPADQPMAWIYPNPGPMHTSILFHRAP